MKINWTRSLRPGVLAVAGIDAVTASLASLASLSPAASAVAVPTQKYISYNGSAQSFTVPSAVTQIFVSAIGGAGSGNRR